MKIWVIVLMLMIYFSNDVCTERIVHEDTTLLETDNKVEGTDKIIVPDVIQESEGEITAVMKWMENISDNERTADELIKTVYTEDELTNFDPQLQTIMNKNLAECVRIFDENVFYIVLKSPSRYLFLEYDLTQSIYFPIYITYSDCKLTWSDFNLILPNVSTIEDLKRIDSYGRYSTDPARSIPFSSTHYTVDGYRIVVRYSMNGIIKYPYSVETVTKYEMPHPLNEILLDRDRELLL